MVKKTKKEIDDEKNNLEENEKEEDPRLRNNKFSDAWKNAFNGIIYATTTQKNIKIQLIIAVIVVIISLFFNLNRAEFLCFLFTIILILFAEMVNTAVETLVDLYIDIYHPKAKIAKDVAAGGVAITAINAIIVAYFLFFDKISDIGLNFIKNVTTNPTHLAFSVIIITAIAILALIAYFKTQKRKIKKKRFIPSGYATIAFAANTIIWLLTDNSIILILSLIMAILLTESRMASKNHTLSEVVFGGCFGIIMVLILYLIAFGIIQVI